MASITDDQILPLCDNAFCVLSTSELGLRPFNSSGLDVQLNLIVTFLFPNSSPFKIPSKPALSISPLPSTKNSTTKIPEVTSPLSNGLQVSIYFSENNNSVIAQELLPIKPLLTDIRSLPSRPNHFNIHLDLSTFGRQYRPEYYANRARKIKWPRFNHHLQYSLKPESSAWKIVFWDSRRQRNPIQIHLYLLNECFYHHKWPPNFPADTAQPSCTSLFPS